jgi:hypothetical protein
MATTYEKIATTTLGSAASTITFSSIAASWTDLRLVWVGVTAAVSNPGIYFNGDTSALYSVTRMSADAYSNVYSSRSTGDGKFVLGYATVTSTTLPTMITADLFSYAGSTYKTGLCTFNGDQIGNGGLDYTVGLYRSTSAITSVTITTNANNMNIGTTATLYGIKAA